MRLWSSPSGGGWLALLGREGEGRMRERKDGSSLWRSEEFGESSRLSNASRRLFPWPASRADFFWLSRHKKSSKKMSAFKTLNLAAPHSQIKNLIHPAEAPHSKCGTPCQSYRDEGRPQSHALREESRLHRVVSF